MEILKIAINHEGKITFVVGDPNDSAEEWYDIILDDKWLKVLKKMIKLQYQVTDEEKKN